MTIWIRLVLAMPILIIGLLAVNLAILIAGKGNLGRFYNEH